MFAFPAGAFLGVDRGLYPFADACGPEIDDYCADTDDLGNCMLANRFSLDGDCGDAFYYWAGDRWGWRDPDMRGRWDTMNHMDRRAYVANHWGDYDEAHREIREGRDRFGPSGIMNRPPEMGGFHGDGGFHGGGSFHGGGGMRR